MYFGSKSRGKFRVQLDISDGTFVHIAVITTFLQSLLLSWMVPSLTGSECASHLVFCFKLLGLLDAQKLSFCR